MPSIIFFSPFLFSLAHTHHYIEIVRTRGLKQALLGVGFQVFYTTLFGISSTFLLLRTGHLPAVILTHTFCNHMGFPAFPWSRLDPFWEQRHIWAGSTFSVCCSLSGFSLP